jgi:hypothetical protein
VLARLCLVLIIFLFADSTLPNGIRVYDFTSDVHSTESFVLTAGYRTDGLREIAGARGLTEVVAAFLKSTPSVRAIEIAAYGAGGSVEYFSDLDRTGIRLKMPNWARSMVEPSIAEFLSETPQNNPDLVDRALAEVRSRKPSQSDIPAGVEAQLRSALLGSYAQADLSEVSRETVNEFFAKYYGTNRAFAVTNTARLESLLSVERRSSEDPRPKTEESLGNVRHPQLSPTPSDLDEGAVILGMPTPSIYYRNWYAVLMLDRLIPQVISEKAVTTLLPALDSYYYRMEVTVPSGQREDSIESQLLQELNQLQYVRVSKEQLETARRSAIQYLESEAVGRWYESLGIPDRRLEGIQWVREFSADDMRITARGIVESKPVIAGWSPRPRALRLDVENLSDLATRTESPVAISLPPLSPVSVTAFPPHTDAEFKEEAPERLPSGVSVVASSVYAVFVAPDSLKVLDGEPGMDAIQSEFGAFRADRILVMAPPELRYRIQQEWARFHGNASDQTAPFIGGNITSADIPALFVLKMLLDRRLIEAGYWNDVRLDIRAGEGSTLAIQGSEANRKVVMNWIQEIASRPPEDADMQWAIEAAIHHLPSALPELQSLIWIWNPAGVLTDFRWIPASQIQEVARIYLQ